MSLNWNIAEIADWESTCRDTDGTLHPVTHNIITGMMVVGMGSITKANVDEVAWRFDLYQRLFGPLVVQVEGNEFVPRPINHADIQAHVGLSTNVGLETRTRWVKRTLDTHYEEFTRNNKKERTGR